MQQKVVGIGMMHLRRRDFLGHLVPAPDFGIQQRVSDFLDWIEFGCVGAEPELPSFLENQRRIVARLDQLSATIEEARRLRSASVETTEALMLSTLSHLSEDLLARYHAQPLERLTSYIGDMNHEMPKGAENGIPFISPKDFTSDGKVDFVGAKRISQDDFLRLSEKCRPEKGDILMARYGTIGAARLVETDEPFLASYSIAIIRPLLAEVNNRFLGSPREFVKAFKYRGFSEMAFLGRLGG
jgi:restriction endonuclease S subunit